jgi:hypothetical protein
MSDVGTPSAAHTCATLQSKAVRTLRGGTAAMRSAGRLFLPMETAEEYQAYPLWCRLCKRRRIGHRRGDYDAQLQ